MKTPMCNGIFSVTFLFLFILLLMLQLVGGGDGRSIIYEYLVDNNRIKSTRVEDS